MPKDAAPVFDAEFRLLLACSKLPVDEEAVRNLASQVQDWEKLLRYAEWHGLTPLICNTLIDSRCSLSSGTSELLMTMVRENARKNLQFTAELLRIMRALLAKNIPAIPYKGPVLAASAYNNLAVRDFCDLDILLAGKDVQRALSIMLELGYKGEYVLTAAQEASYLRTTCEYNFLNASNQVMVEIHWQVAPIRFGLTFEFDRLWSRARLLRIGGSSLRVLSPEDLLLVLSIHGFKHLWSCLKWVCDVAMVLSSAEDVDSTYILDEANRMGALRVVLVALCLANQMFGAELSEPILARLRRDSVAGAVAKQIVNSYEPANSMSPLKARLLMLRAFSGFRNRASYIKRVLLDPSMEEAVLATERPMSAMRTRRMLHVARQGISEYRQSRTN